MKISGILLSVIFFLLLSMPSQAQQVLNNDNLRTIQVDQISDEEIMAYYQRAKNAGISDNQLLKMAADRGMPADQIARLKKRIEKLATSPAIKTSPDDKDGSQKEESKISAEAMKPSLTKLKRDSTIFGAELFDEASTVFEPNFKIATPASYVLGPGDELVVQVFGYSEQTYNLTVSTEGNVYIPNVGPIAISGLQIEDAGSRIRNKLGATIYKAIRSGQTRVEISLGKIRSVSVTVIGQASKPGTYAIPSLSTVYNLLYLCGGPSDQGSFRAIELVRDNKVYRTIDLYGFLLRGDRLDNVLLKDQDVIRIPYYKTRVQITGYVKRPGKYEMLPNENLDQLMTYSGGFADSAYKGMIKLVRLSDTGRLLADISTSDFGSFFPQTGDAFSIGMSPARFSNRVAIKGAVYRPDNYELKPGMELKTLLAQAGLRPDSYLDRGFISRLNDDHSTSSISFHPTNILNGTASVQLQKEDIVTIFSLDDLVEAKSVEVKGEVRLPGKYNFSKNLNLQDLLLQAGGFTNAADVTSIEISRRVLNPEISGNAYQQAKIIHVDLENGLAGSGDNILLEPSDVINVRTRSSYENSRSVNIVGQINSPGNYVLQSSNETISSILARAGGFKTSADSSSVSIRRVTRLGLSKEEKELAIQKLLKIDRDSLIHNPALRDTYLRDIDFLNVSLNRIKENPGGSEDVILEDGDYIEVARASSLVRVSGEVFHSSLLPYKEGASARYYIKQSGNFTNNARARRTFVIYPDGRAKSVKTFLFFKSYPDVTARSEIFVPGKDQEGRKAWSATEWIAVSTIIATLATMTITVVNALK